MRGEESGWSCWGVKSRGSSEFWSNSHSGNSGSSFSSMEWFGRKESRVNGNWNWMRALTLASSKNNKSLSDRHRFRRSSGHTHSRLLFSSDDNNNLLLWFSKNKLIFFYKRINFMITYICYNLFDFFLPCHWYEVFTIINKG